MKHIKKILIPVVILFLIIELTGCGSPGKGVLPQDTGASMVEVYQQETGSGGAEYANQQPTTETTKNAYTKVAIKKVVHVDEVVGDAGDYYKPVENLRMRIYVYPHRTYNNDGEESVVPGYYTYFPLYSHQHYYLPNEAY